MNRINTSLILALILIFSSCKKDEEPVIEENQGYKMLLMGHSYFKPYAERLEEVAIDAGYLNHNQTFVFSSGGSGFPISLWNDTGAKNQQIKN